MNETNAPSEHRRFMNEQVTVRMPNNLLSRVDRLAESGYQTRGAWMRSAVLEKARREERMIREGSVQN